MHNLWLVGLWTYQFLDISHIDWKRDEKQNKYGSILDKNGISRKRTKKPLSRLRKYENGIPQIWNRTEERRKRNRSDRDFFRPFSTRTAPLDACRLDDDASVHRPAGRPPVTTTGRHETNWWPQASGHQAYAYVRALHPWPRCTTLAKLGLSSTFLG